MTVQSQIWKKESNTRNKKVTNLDPICSQNTKMVRSSLCYMLMNLFYKIKFTQKFYVALLLSNLLFLGCLNRKFHQSQDMK